MHSCDLLVQIRQVLRGNVSIRKDLDGQPIHFFISYSLKYFFFSMIESAFVENWIYDVKQGELIRFLAHFWNKITLRLSRHCSLCSWNVWYWQFNLFERTFVRFAREFFKTDSSFTFKGPFVLKFFRFARKTFNNDSKIFWEKNPFRTDGDNEIIAVVKVNRLKPVTSHE